MEKGLLGKAYGVVTAKALAVLEALLWAFHNAGSGLCFPSYERIAEAAGCARSSVAEAIKALEASLSRTSPKRRQIEPMGWPRGCLAGFVFAARKPR